MGEEIEADRRRVQAGECDLRDVGLLLTGRWDQDFPARILEAAADLASAQKQIDRITKALALAILATT